MKTKRLKIKEDKLNELKKFGFVKVENEYIYHYLDNLEIIVVREDRTICFTLEEDEETDYYRNGIEIEDKLYILFNLIKADLVEIDE